MIIRIDEERMNASTKLAKKCYYRRRGIRTTGEKSILCATMFCISEKKSRTIFKSNSQSNILLLSFKKDFYGTYFQ